MTHLPAYGLWIWVLQRLMPGLGGSWNDRCHCHVAITSCIFKVMPYAQSN